MSMSYSEEIAGRINKFLSEENWKYDFNKEDGLFRFGVNIKSKLKSLRCFILVREDAYSVYAVSPINADNNDSSVMAEMAVFICRANYGLRNGNFDFDVKDGEIRYKVYVDCEGVMPSDSIIRTSIFIPSLMFERYSPGLLDVMFRGAKAEEAIAQCG